MYFPRYSLLDPNLTYFGGLYSCVQFLWSLLCGEQWNTTWCSGFGKWEWPAACWLPSCMLGIGGPCTGKLYTSLWVCRREITLIFSDAFGSCFQHQPARQFQVGEIEKGNWCGQWLSSGQDWGWSFESMALSCPKGLSWWLGSLSHGQAGTGLVWSKVFSKSQWGYN